jgi:hypothetical protein
MCYELLAPQWPGRPWGEIEQSRLFVTSTSAAAGGCGETSRRGRQSGGRGGTPFTGGYTRNPAPTLDFIGDSESLPAPEPATFLKEGDTPETIWLKVGELIVDGRKAEQTKFATKFATKCWTLHRQGYGGAGTPIRWF